MCRFLPPSQVHTFPALFRTALTPEHTMVESIPHCLFGGTTKVNSHNNKSHSTTTMILLLLLLTLCVKAGKATCSGLCPNGGSITKPNAVVMPFAETPTLTCQQLQESPKFQALDKETCLQAQVYLGIGDCRCDPPKNACTVCVTTAPTMTTTQNTTTTTNNNSIQIALHVKPLLPQIATVTPFLKHQRSNVHCVAQAMNSMKMTKSVCTIKKEFLTW